MAIPVIIPRLGWNMEQGIFLGWLKSDGETIRAGEMLFRLESEKAAEDVECLDGGILRIASNGPREGDTLPVGAVIGHLLQPGETCAPAAEVSSPTPRVSAEKPSPSPASTAVVVKTVPLASHSSAAVASPRARRVAAELGVDWKGLPGSGRKGRIRESDVRSAMAKRAGGKTVPLGSLRRKSAERLTKSKQATVPVTLTTTVNATNLVNLRLQFKEVAENGNAIPSLSDFFVLLTARALQEHPLLTARWAEDHLVLPEEIHIGIAVDTEAGLLVPVIHRVPALSLTQLAVQSRDLIQRARQGTLNLKDQEGGVFTVTNLGSFGIDAFTPVINHPECAILGIGCIRRQPVFVDDKVMAQDQTTLSLTFDHRIVDGAPAARFLQKLTRMLENPAPWLIGP